LTRYNTHITRPPTIPVRFSQYLLFAYSSDLANNAEWLQKEFYRAAVSAASNKASLDCIDRVVVLDRGMFNPGGAVGTWESSSPETSFLDSYLHLINFVTRESKRRPPIDWQMYGPRNQKGWKKLKAVQPDVEADDDRSGS
jgi:hypothetical protein